jgi:hypothetical protein
MITTTMLLLALVLTQASSATSIQVSAPAQVSTIDAGKLKGEPTQLAWSPDGTKLFLQTSERDARGMVTNPRFFVMSAGEGKPEPVDAPPAWATEYWAWKSDKFAPGSKTFGIQVTQEDRKSTATSSPMGGDLAKGGGAGDPNAGSSSGDVASQVAQTQTQRVFVLKLKGELVGEFVNQQFLPGYTFGWSPRDPMVAYGHASGRLAVMDEQGHTQQVSGTKNVILPAWSSDGSKIAFLQKTGKKKYDLVLVKVTP